jgi:uncharacterized membrane protein YfcA
MSRSEAAQAIAWAIGNAVATAIGARLAHSLPQRKFEIGFALFLLLVASRFAASPVVSAI